MFKLYLMRIPDSGISMQHYGGDFVWPSPFDHHTSSTTSALEPSTTPHESCAACLADPECPYMRRLQCQAPQENFGTLFSWVCLALLNLGTAVLYLVTALLASPVATGVQHPAV